MRSTTCAARRGERLTWEQVCQKYPDAWVVMVDTDWINDIDFAFGTTCVIGHFERRNDASPLIKAGVGVHASIGCYWTGDARGPLRALLA